jgi:hypothetical protein
MPKELNMKSDNNILTDERRALIKEWNDTMFFHIGLPDNEFDLIVDLLDETIYYQYSDYDKDVLNKIRDKWIDYNKWK